MNMYVDNRGPLGNMKGVCKKIAPQSHDVFQDISK